MSHKNRAGPKSANGDPESEDMGVDEREEPRPGTSGQNTASESEGGAGGDDTQAEEPSDDDYTWGEAANDAKKGESDSDEVRVPIPITSGKKLEVPLSNINNKRACWKQRSLTDLLSRAVSQHPLSMVTVHCQVEQIRPKRLRSDDQPVEADSTDVNNLQILNELDSRIEPDSMPLTKKAKRTYSPRYNDFLKDTEDQFDKALSRIDEITMGAKSQSGNNTKIVGTKSKMAPTDHQTKRNTVNVSHRFPVVEQNKQDPFGITHTYTKDRNNDTVKLTSISQKNKKPNQVNPVIEILHVHESENEITDDCFSIDLLQDFDTDRLPEDAHSVWKQARTAAVDAMKNRKKSKFYTKALKKGLKEPWTEGREPAPPFAKHRPLSDKIEQLRRQLSDDIMQAAADHLKRVGDKFARVSAGQLNTVENMTRKALKELKQEEKTNMTYDKAVQALENLVEREAAKEEKILEERSKYLAKNKATSVDYVDPATAVIKKQRESNKQGWDFPQGEYRGRGRFMGRRPGRRGRGRRPNSRPY